VSPGSLEDDVMRRLEDAKKHVVHSMLEVALNNDGAASSAMCAIIEIEMALGCLRGELRMLNEQPEEPCAPVEPAPSKIRNLAGALSSKSRGASQ
jgi:hypothetical protein